MPPSTNRPRRVVWVSILVAYVLFPLLAVLWPEPHPRSFALHSWIATGLIALFGTICGLVDAIAACSRGKAWLGAVNLLLTLARGALFLLSLCLAVLLLTGQLRD